MSAAVEVPWMLADSKAEFGPLFENAPLALARCQRHGNITALTPALEQMLGVRSSIAVRLVDLFHSEDRAESGRLISELFDGKRSSFQIDSRTAGPNGRPVRWTVWRVRETTGTADYALVMAQELSDTPAAEPRLRQAERLESVGRLAGGVAHDFNNLLTGVLLYCDLLLASIEPLHRARKYAEEIRKAGQQASALVRQLLAIARPASCQPQPLSLNEIALSMRNLLVRLIGENIELKIYLDPHLGLIKMDPTQAQQILLNLVLNARDAMPGGGQITIETSNCRVEAVTNGRLGAGSRASLPCALFLVEDNGKGMDASTLAQVFEPFFTTKAGKGTGLGLANVHDIVTGNGGLIHLDSTPGKGTRVSVLLPLVPEAHPESVSSNSSHPFKSGEVFSSKEEE